MNKFAFTLLAAGAMVVSSCTTEDLNPSLEQNKEAANAIQTSADLEGILKGGYSRMTSSGYYGRDYIVTNEARTPNVWANGSSGRFTTEARLAYTPGSTYIWDNAYSVIASANIIIGADIENLTDDNAEFARHMQGEAYAMRALAHFDLVKTYGQEHVGGDLGVPYLLEFKGEDMIPARETLDQNRAQLFSDIRTAFEMMDESIGNKERFTKLAAKALESKMAVWFGMWAEARDAAFDVIDSGIYDVAGPEEFVNNFATDGGSNIIFELAFDATDNAGINGLEYIYRGDSYGDISVAPNAWNLYDKGDVRGYLEDAPTILGYEELDDIGTQMRNLGKYPERSSNVPVLRYEEVILNYAEALLELGEGDPLAWLNMIPENRAIAYPELDENGDPVLDAEGEVVMVTPDLTYDDATKDNILEERRKEFMFEGLYYYDLLRTGQGVEKIDAEQNLDASIPYGDTRLVNPIPSAELDANSNMVQNPGYTG